MKLIKGTSLFLSLSLVGLVVAPNVGAGVVNNNEGYSKFYHAPSKMTIVEGGVGYKMYSTTTLEVPLGKSYPTEQPASVVYNGRTLSGSLKIIKIENTGYSLIIHYGGEVTG